MACRRPSLPVLGTVPPFALTERGGDAVRSEDLAGHVWVADFVFTRCPDFCPALTGRFARLQRELDVATDGIRLVSFSVDPTHDTPEVLQGYAARAKKWVGNAAYGNYEAWATVLVAPRAFAERFPKETKVFGAFIAYEDIAAFVPTFGAE